MKKGTRMAVVAALLWLGFSSLSARQVLPDTQAGSLGQAAQAQRQSPSQTDRDPTLFLTAAQIGKLIPL